MSAAGASYSSTVPSYPAPITSAADSILGEGRSVIKVSERTKYFSPTKNIFLQVPAHRPQVAGVGSLPLPLDYSAAPWLYRPAAISGLPSYLPLPSSLLLNRFGGNIMSILKISTSFLEIYVLLVGEGCLITASALLHQRLLLNDLL